MSGLLSGLFGTGSKSVPARALTVQTSLQGVPIPIMWGQARMSANLINYTDFRVSSAGSGKGGVLSGGKSGGSGYYYSAAVELALCQGPIASIPQVWQNSSSVSLAFLNLTLLAGSYTQGPWGYTQSLHPSQALDYRGLARVAAGPLALGQSATLPNLSFEVRGAISYALAGLPDADPSAVIADLLSNPNYGVGFTTSLIGDLSTYTAYCRATGMLVSPTISNLTTAQDFVKTLLEATNANAVWSQGQVRIVPYGDQAITAGTIVQVTEVHTIPTPQAPSPLPRGYVTPPPTIVLSVPGTFVADLGVINSATGTPFVEVTGTPASGHYSSSTPGTYVFSVYDEQIPISITYTYSEPATYTPPSAPQYALGDDDYVRSQNGGGNQPVLITRSAPQTQKNSVIVNFLDRSNAYALTPTPAAKDDAAIQNYGLLQDNVKDYQFFCYGEAAQQSAHLLLGRQQVRNTYQFTLGAKYVLLDPMDIVSLTDAATGLSDHWVRLTEITSLIQQLKDAEGKIRSLETDQKAMSAQLAVIESRAVQAPFPEWDVDRASRYVWCNVEFERIFLMPKGKDRQWAIGKSHADVWPEETARVLISMDGEASMRPSRTAMRDGVELPGDDALFRIVKFAALNSLTGAHIGFHGLAIPANF